MSERGSDPNAASLIGFWRFADGREQGDTGHGQRLADASAVADNRAGNGRQGCFSTDGPDAFVDLTEGTIAVRFTPGDQADHPTDVLVSCGTDGDRLHDACFALGATGDGRVTVTHFTQDAPLELKTQNRLFSEAEEVAITYGWSAKDGGTLRVQNLTRHTETHIDFDTTGLTLIMNDDDDKNVIFGAFFKGPIDVLALYDRDIINTPAVPDGIVARSDDDDLINLDYLNDADGGCIASPNALMAGADDSIVYAGVGDIIHVEIGGDDVDTLDLTRLAVARTPVPTFAPDNRDDGTITFSKADGVSTEPSVFEDIENITSGPTPICFTPGTLIATPDGQRPVEDLRPGDRVITRDNGIQEISWTGMRGLTGVELALHVHLRPIKISKGALGRNLPTRDMLLSPNHRVLVYSDETVLFFEESEVLVAAKHLAGLPGVQRAHVPWTTYIHFMFTQHEVVLSDGIWTESFQPGGYSLAGIGNVQRTELEHLFPELRTPEGVASFQAARRSLKQHEAQLLNK